jgi:hypothetical protein
LLHEADARRVKEFTSIKLGAITLGVGLFLGGLASVIWQPAGVLPHLTNDAFGLRHRTYIEVVTSDEARVYGILGMLLGAGIVALALCREEKEDTSFDHLIMGRPGDNKEGEK